MDELYLPVPGATDDELGYFLVIMQTPKGNEGESFAWYCQKCITLLYEVRYHSGELGLKNFWRAEVNAVREYNRDAKNRIVHLASERRITAVRRRSCRLR